MSPAAGLFLKTSPREHQTQSLLNHTGSERRVWGRRLAWLNASPPPLKGTLPPPKDDRFSTIPFKFLTLILQSARHRQLVLPGGRDTLLSPAGLASPSCNQVTHVRIKSAEILFWGLVGFLLKRSVLFVGCLSAMCDFIFTESRGFKCHLHN